MRPEDLTPFERYSLKEFIEYKSHHGIFSQRRFFDLLNSSPFLSWMIKDTLKGKMYYCYKDHYEKEIGHEIEVNMKDSIQKVFNCLKLAAKKPSYKDEKHFVAVTVDKVFGMLGY